MNYQARRQAGFTLIEVMVVVVILGILAAFIVPKIMSRPDEARVIKAKQDIRAVKQALDLYRMDNYFYPSTDQGLEALVTPPSGDPEPRNWRKEGYLDGIPRDPWGNPYLYLSPGENGPYDVYTLGADAQQGGEDASADIGSWNLDK